MLKKNSSVLNTNLNKQKTSINLNTRNKTEISTTKSFFKPKIVDYDKSIVKKSQEESKVKSLVEDDLATDKSSSSNKKSILQPEFSQEKLSAKKSYSKSTVFNRLHTNVLEKYKLHEITCQNNTLSKLDQDYSSNKEINDIDVKICNNFYINSDKNKIDNVSNDTIDIFSKFDNKNEQQNNSSSINDKKQSIYNQSSLNLESIENNSRDNIIETPDPQNFISTIKTNSFSINNKKNKNKSSSISSSQNLSNLSIISKISNKENIHVEDKNQNNKLKYDKKVKSRNISKDVNVQNRLYKNVLKDNQIKLKNNYTNNLNDDRKNNINRQLNEIENIKSINKDQEQKLSDGKKINNKLIRNNTTKSLDHIKTKKILVEKDLTHINKNLKKIDKNENSSTDNLKNTDYEISQVAQDEQSLNKINPEESNINAIDCSNIQLNNKKRSHQDTPEWAKSVKNHSKKIDFQAQKYTDSNPKNIFQKYTKNQENGIILEDNINFSKFREIIDKDSKIEDSCMHIEDMDQSDHKNTFNQSLTKQIEKDQTINKKDSIESVNKNVIQCNKSISTNYNLDLEYHQIQI